MIEEIRAGKYDDKLELLINEIEARKACLGAAKFYQFQINEKVRIVNASNIRPAYLRGREVIVTDKRQKNFVVKLVQVNPGERFARGIVLDPTHLERIS